MKVFCYVNFLSDVPPLHNCNYRYLRIRGLIYKTVRGIHIKSLRVHKSQKWRTVQKILINKTMRTHT